MRSKDELEQAIARGTRAAAIRRSERHHREAAVIEKRLDGLRAELAAVEREQAPA